MKVELEVWVLVMFKNCLLFVVLDWCVVNVEFVVYFMFEDLIVMVI